MPAGLDATAGAHHEQMLLVFDPRTGELLAHEMVVLDQARLAASLVILATDRTDQLG